MLIAVILFLLVGTHSVAFLLGIGLAKSVAERRARERARCIAALRQVTKHE